MMPLLCSEPQWYTYDSIYTTLSTILYLSFARTGESIALRYPRYSVDPPVPLLHDPSSDDWPHERQPLLHLHVLGIGLYSTAEEHKMAQCKRCGKKGLFLALSEWGLCKECHVVVALDVQERVRIIKSSAKVAEGSKKLETKLSRMDLMKEHLEALLEYERMEISTINPSPSSLLAELRRDRHNIVVQGVEDAVDTALTKAQVAATPKSGITQASKALLSISDAEKELDDPSVLAPYREKVEAYIHRTTLDSHLDAAHKAEFKGNAKKALDAYQEALYFLRTDSIDDSQQTQQIADLEEKIEQLRKQLSDK